MHSPSSSSTHTLRAARERALDRVRYASWLAIGGGVLGTILFTIIGFDTGDWSATLKYLIGSAASIALGVGLYRTKHWLLAAFLFVNAVGTMIWRTIESGGVSATLVGLLFGYVYFLGMRGAIDLGERDTRAAQTGE